MHYFAAMHLRESAVFGRVVRHGFQYSFSQRESLMTAIQ
jgi:hypothetical protein